MGLVHSKFFRKKLCYHVSFFICVEHMSVQFFKMKSVCFVIPTYKLHMPAKNIDEQIQVELDRIYKGRAIYVHHDGAFEHDFALM